MMGGLRAGTAEAAPGPAARPEEELAMMMEVSEDEYVSNNNFATGYQLTRPTFKPRGSVFGLQ